MTADQDAAWEAAYRAAFRCVARIRGWRLDDIESGWLDEWPREARICAAPGADPCEAGARDVLIAEREAANA